MAIGVQTDMCTPALARFGSRRAARASSSRPAIAGDQVGCIGVSEVGGGSDVAALKTTRAQGRRRLRDQRQQDVDHQRPQADWCCLLANTAEGRPHKNKTLIIVPMDAPGITRHKIDKLGMHSVATPRSCSSTTCACRSATSSARRAWAS